jgi:hypothetical protein
LTTTIEIQHNIPAPISLVWSELEQLDRHVLWMTDAVRIDFQSDQRKGVGTRFICLTKVGPLSVNDHMTVTKWVDHHAISVEHKGLFKGVGTFSLEAIGPDWTQVQWHESLDFPLLFGRGLGEAIASPLLRSIWRKNLRRLEETVIPKVNKERNS